MPNGNLKLALQKKGRLTDKSLQLLKNCDLDIEDYNDRLIVSAKNLKLDLLFLRDDDIPEYVSDGVADIGIVGEDEIFEKQADVNIIRKLGFGKCKLSIAAPEGVNVEKPSDLINKKIATSYPNLLKDYLNKNNIKAKVIEISGSVEITPSLGVADLICDIVSTGNTLKINKLVKSFDIFSSETAIIANKNINEDSKKVELLDDLLNRIDSALIARRSKYLMMNAPEESIERIKNILPALKSPTVMPLAEKGMVAIHAVIPNEQFWIINKELKKEGASGILLLPIENMIP
ncbi:MAG TPA: ATP phosphoribosyltransferase [Melioribacteraceae bacterium]|nr:ATP phosphoribosyltransferase [Melioribacteraceae bacterium]